MVENSNCFNFRDLLVIKLRMFWLKFVLYERLQDEAITMSSSSTVCNGSSLRMIKKSILTTSLAAHKKPKRKAVKDLLNTAFYGAKKASHSTDHWLRGFNLFLVIRVGLSLLRGQPIRRRVAIKSLRVSTPTRQGTISV